MRAIGYVRVSTDEQAASGLGLAAQEATIRHEAERRGWKVEIVSDDGYSAKNLHRPGITDALDQLRHGEADVLLVAKLDRLSRSLLDFADLTERARREGWALVALDLGVDTSTAAGELVANVMASVAQWERRVIGERTSAAMQAKKAQGARLGRPSALAADVLERIVQERGAGLSLSAIAAGLNADGIPTAKGRQWEATTVRRAVQTARLNAEAAAVKEAAA